MKFRKIDEKLFAAVTPEDRQKNNTMACYAEKRIRLLHTAEDARAAAGLLEKTVSESVAFEYTGEIKNDSRVIAGDFPPAYYPETFSQPRQFGRKTEYIPLDHFYQMQEWYKQDHSDLSKLPWEFGDMLKGLRRAADSAAPTFWGRFGGAFKWLGITLLSAAVAVFSFLGDQYDWFDFLSLLILVMAGVFIIACIATLVGLLMTLVKLTEGPSEESKKKFVHQYQAAVKFVRLRMLWCKEVTGKDAVPEYLMDAQKAIEKTARRGRKILKKRLGAGWELPRETVLRAEELRLGPAPVPPAPPAEAPQKDQEAAWLLAAKAEAAAVTGDMERAGQMLYEACLLDPEAAERHVRLYRLNPKVDWMLAEQMCELIPTEEERKYQLTQVYLGAAGEYMERMLPGESQSNEAFYQHFKQPEIQAMTEKLMYFLRKLHDIGEENLPMILLSQINSSHTLDDAREACHWLKMWLDTQPSEDERYSIMWYYRRRFKELAKEYDECGLQAYGDRFWELLTDIGDASSMGLLATRYLERGYAVSAKEWAKKAMNAGADKMRCEIIIAMADKKMKNGR